MFHPLAQYIDSIPDFPEKGILFRDISPLLEKKFPDSIRSMLDLFSNAEIDSIDGFAGIDARGFVFAAAMAALSGKSMIMVRKKGKLPPPVISKNYQLEYGLSCLEMRPPHTPSRIIIVDDVLATGGTLGASADLCAEAGHTVVGFATLINLSFLNDFSWHSLKVRSLISYDE